MKKKANGHAKPRGKRRKPRPAKTEAEKWDIARLRRIKDLRVLLRYRYGPTVPGDDAGREDLFWLLLHISAGPHALVKMHHTVDVLAPWMTASEREQFVGRVSCEPHLPSARRLGRELNVNHELREQLGLWSTWPCDMTAAQMVEWRKAKDRARKRERRGAKSRANYLAANTVNRTKPWLAAGISRRTWYRRQAAARRSAPQTNTSGSCRHADRA